MIAQNGKVIPIEVKSGKGYERHSALTNVLANRDYNIEFAYVLTNDNHVFLKIHSPSHF